MKLIPGAAKKHLVDQNETYFEHMWGAWKIVCLLNVLAFKCFIHSIFPFLYTGAVSEKIECLQRLTKRNKK
jgi:hypothetical protein